MRETRKEQGAKTKRRPSMEFEKRPVAQARGPLCEVDSGVKIDKKNSRHPMKGGDYLRRGVRG